MNTLRVLLLSIILIVGSNVLQSQDYTLTKMMVGNNSGFVAGNAGAGYFMQGNFGQSIVGRVTADGDKVYLGYWNELDLILLSVENGKEISDRKIQNFPNPFRDYTDIKFELSGASNVSLKIYDMNGSLVNELFRGYLGTGEHSVSWNGFRADGQLASTGTYLYELSVEPLAGSSLYAKSYTLRNTMVLSK